MTGHRDCVYTLQGSSSNSIFFSGSGDGMVVAWDLTQPESGNLLAKLPNSVYALHHHPESNLLVAGQNYAGVHFLDWQQGKEIGSLQLTKSAIFDMQSYGKNLLVATGEGRLIKVDMESMAVLKSVQLADKSARTISISRVLGEIAVGYSDNSIRIFNLDDLALEK